MQKVWKSVKIWQSYREYKGGNFFEIQCIFYTDSEAGRSQNVTESRFIPTDIFYDYHAEIQGTWSRSEIN